MATYHLDYENKRGGSGVSYFATFAEMADFFDRKRTTWKRAHGWEYEDGQMDEAQEVAWVEPCDEARDLLDHPRRIKYHWGIERRADARGPQ